MQPKVLTAGPIDLQCMKLKASWHEGLSAREEHKPSPLSGEAPVSSRAPTTHVFATCDPRTAAARRHGKPSKASRCPLRSILLQSLDLLGVRSSLQESTGRGQLGAGVSKLGHLFLIACSRHAITMQRMSVCDVASNLVPSIPLGRTLHVMVAACFPVRNEKLAACMLKG